MEATEHFRTGKAYREGDVWELYLLHRLLDMAGLLEERAGLCQLTASRENVCITVEDASGRNAVVCGPRARAIGGSGGLQ